MTKIIKVAKYYTTFKHKLCICAYKRYFTSYFQASLTSSITLNEDYLSFCSITKFRLCRMWYRNVHLSPGRMRIRPKECEWFCRFRLNISPKKRNRSFSLGSPTAPLWYRAYISSTRSTGFADHCMGD